MKGKKHNPLIRPIGTIGAMSCGPVRRKKRKKKSRSRGRY